MTVEWGLPVESNLQRRARSFQVPATESHRRSSMLDGGLDRLLNGLAQMQRMIGRHMHVPP